MSFKKSYLKYVGMKDLWESLKWQQYIILHTLEEELWLRSLAYR